MYMHIYICYMCTDRQTNSYNSSSGICESGRLCSVGAKAACTIPWCRHTLGILICRCCFQSLLAERLHALHVSDWYIYIYIHLQTHAHPHIHRQIQVHIHIRKSIQIHYVCIHTKMYLCIYLHVYAHNYIII